MMTSRDECHKVRIVCLLWKQGYRMFLTVNVMNAYLVRFKARKLDSKSMMASRDECHKVRIVYLLCKQGYKTLMFPTLMS